MYIMLLFSFTFSPSLSFFPLLLLLLFLQMRRSSLGGRLTLDLEPPHTLLDLKCLDRHRVGICFYWVGGASTVLYLYF